jgi:HAD superfamily hydrolase (TIGR01549 family)
MDKDRQMKHMDYSVFDYRFISCELGMRKPNKEIYEYVNNALKNYEILFIDDREINLKFPKELGWKTYCANSGGDLNGIKNACETFLK